KIASSAVVPGKGSLLLAARWLSVLVALALLAVIVYASLPGAGPRCVVETPALELGELSAGEHSVQVPIVNPGSSPLRISEVISSCTCAVVKAPDEVSPGGRAAIEIQIGVSPGPRSAVLKIVSNDPRGPKRVAISWNGGTRLRLIPYSVRPAPLPSDQPFEQTVQVIYPGGKSAPVPNLQHWECDSPLVQVTEGRNDSAALKFGRGGLATNVLGQLDLHIRVQPPSQPGAVRATCKLTIGCGKSTYNLNLPVNVPFINGPLTTDVSNVVFSSSQPNE